MCSNCQNGFSAPTYDLPAMSLPIHSPATSIFEAIRSDNRKKQRRHLSDCCGLCNTDVTGDVACSTCSVLYLAFFLICFILTLYKILYHLSNMKILFTFCLLLICVDA